MKRHLFWRLTHTPYKTNAIFSQILAAVADVARRDFCRLDRSDVHRAHITIYCSNLALVETGHGAGDDPIDPIRCAQMCASERIRGSGSSFLACTSWRFSYPREDVDVVWRSSARLRSFCRKRRIHQSFVKSRNPSARDVLLDIAGALLGLLIGVSFAHRRPKTTQGTAQNQFVDAAL